MCAFNRRQGVQNIIWFVRTFLLKSHNDRKLSELRQMLIRGPTGGTKQKKKHKILTKINNNENNNHKKLL